MDAPFSQGRVLLGKYRVERVIGKGAMGVVLAARHIELDDRVAIKLLLPEMLAEEGVVERFLQEARAVRKIKSEHVAHVFDVGRLDDGTPYIIMEYLEGRDLARLRGDRGTFEVEEVVEYVLQALEAVAEAHANGIIHRDLKPANLFLTRRSDGAPLIKVLDFGTSKMTPKEMREDLEMTKTGMAIGSPSYMAPEQMLSSRNIDHRADIWALGVILYNLLTGTFPFKADTLLQMCAAALQLPPTKPSVHRPDLPAELEDSILKCLAKKPVDRFGDVAELARAIIPFGPVSSLVSVERIERVLGVTSDLATFLAPSHRRPELPPRKSPLPQVAEDFDVQVALLPPSFEARSERNPDLALITKSLRPAELAATSSTLATTTTSAATSTRTTLPGVAPSANSLTSVVRIKEERISKPAPSVRASKKRGTKAIAAGAVATLALGAGLLVTFSRPLASEEAPPPHVPPAAAQAPNRAARAIEIATPVEMGNAPVWADPEPAPAPFPPAEPATATPIGTSPPTPMVARPSGAPFANNAGTKNKQTGQAEGQAQAVNQAPPPPAPQPTPAKKSEPAIVIPDDR
ncbi:MAG: serine/threonine protein kinase [Polyangiaceae bacterium]|nr:serine/threonine protein kinase [Polyangiaceae bacterium]